ncbi:hypothetical protein Pres01_40580 [Metapseudomonas resinovorans]|uniref:hypothetical protein n=1 Tax=Metapseudomonas resinovorans TaxID=53412 RepID=UPI001F18DF7C|nr:hypothetical protein [Pseudomonas resinovorans]GLZ88007.1 hypothetical protein Pres01_40580 [Pseudomonas resinovorans]
MNSNALEIWKATKAVPVPESLPLAQPLNCLVWRHELTRQYRSLDQPESSALQLMARDRQAFPDLCAKLVDVSGEQAPLQAATWLRQWASQGLLLWRS